MEARGNTAWLGKCLVLAGLYAVVGKLSLLLAIPPGYATAVWPSAGIALAVLLTGGSRLWPGVFLGSFLVNLPVAYDGTTGSAVIRSSILAGAIAAGAAAQAAVGAWLVRRSVRQPVELLQESDIIKFLLMGGPVSCLTNATVGVSSLFLLGSVEREDFLINWWTWWVGDSIGVAVTAPFMLVWIGQPREVWRRRRLSLGGPTLAMFFACVAFFFRASAWENARIESDFQYRARATSSTLRHKFEEASEVLRSVEDHYHATGRMTREAFSRFVKPLLSRHSGIKAIAWDRVVTGEGRREFERAAVAEGMPGFQTTEIGPDGKLRPAGDRPVYTVVQYIEPLSTNSLALGLDVAGDPIRAEALRHAARTGRGAATAPVNLVQDVSDAVPSFMMYWPVFGEAGPAGASDTPVAFVTGVYRIPEIVGAALGDTGRSAVSIRIRDLQAPPEKALLYEDSLSDGRKQGKPRLLWSETFDLGGRSWSLECRSGPAHLSVSWRAWTVLAGGLIFTAILGAFLLATTGRTVVIERLNAGQLAGLSEANRALAREIAERKAAEAALQDKENELRQAHKMEAIGRLAGGIAHDFNNLLTPILGYCDLASGKLPPSHPVREELQQILYSAEQASRLTRQLLVFSRKDVIQPKPLDLNLILGEMQKLLTRVLREDIRLESVLRAGLWPIHADPGQIEQVIVNLVVNARDAMPHGGRLTIETMNVTLDPPFAQSHPGLSPGEHVMLAVTDSGTGMTPEVRSQLFVPFFTTKGEGKGTGLGLSTVYGIVKRARGHISVYSELGQGSSFVLYFPRSAHARVSPPEGTVAPQKLSGTEHVMVVEDDPVVRRLVTAVLRTNGYAVTEVADGSAAFQELQRISAEVSLVVADVVMPRLGGMELFLLLSASGIRVRFLCMSGYPEGAALGQGLIREDMPFIHKPFTPTGLLIKIREVLDAPLPTAPSDGKTASIPGTPKDSPTASTG